MAKAEASTTPKIEGDPRKPGHPAQTGCDARPLATGNGTKAGPPIEIPTANVGTGRRISMAQEARTASESLINDEQPGVPEPGSTVPATHQRGGPREVRRGMGITRQTTRRGSLIGADESCSSATAT